MTNNAYAKHLIVTGVTCETRPRGSLTLIRYSLTADRKLTGIGSVPGLATELVGVSLGLTPLDAHRAKLSPPRYQ
jgi:hypothetical protein